MKTYQVVSYFPRWCGINIECFNPDHTDMALIYRWIVRLGFWHVRRWTTPQKTNKPTQQKN